MPLTETADSLDGPAVDCHDRSGRCGHADPGQVRTLTAVRRLLSEGVGALSVRAAAEVLTRVSRSVLETQHAVAYLADPDGRIGDIVTVDVDDEMSRMLHDMLLGVDSDQIPLWRRRLRGEEHPVLVVDDAHDSDLIPREVVDAIHLRSYVAFPVLGADGAVLGGIVCSHSDRARTWLDHERDTVRQLALEGSLIIENAVLREAHERRVAELTEQARTDPLTGLANRTRLFERIEHAAALGRRSRQTIGVVFIDLDDFKHINDTYGHAAGDEVLVAVARALEGCVREEDTVARFAGDEFVVVLEQTTRAETNAAAERIASAFAPLRVRVPATHALGGEHVEIDVTASIGVTATADEASGEALVRRADQAMYRAKRTGQVVASFLPDTDGVPIQRNQRERELREAIGRDELRLVYQPVHELATGRIVAVEALVRWEHPRDGLLAPAAFLPMAEETGLIVPLGEWVLRQACEQLATWNGRRGGDDQLTMSINVSAMQLQRGAFIETLRSVLADTGVDPGRVVIEITETALLSDIDGPTLLAEIRAEGVRAALDDFGVGYSSLRSLQRLPIEILKIDRGFVSEMLDHEGSSVLVAAMVALGDALGMRVIAEGIETAAQADALRALGCPFGQGYLLCRPLPPGELDAVLADA